MRPGLTPALVKIRSNPDRARYFELSQPGPDTSVVIFMTPGLALWFCQPQSSPTNKALKASSAKSPELRGAKVRCSDRELWKVFANGTNATRTVMYTSVSANTIEQC